MMMEYTKITVTEKKIEQNFDQVTTSIAEKFGMKTIPWLKFTYYLTLLYSMITIFVLFQRADFFNLTICVMALYVLMNTNRIT